MSFETIFSSVQLHRNIKYHFIEFLKREISIYHIHATYASDRIDTCIYNLIVHKCARHDEKVTA